MNEFTRAANYLDGASANITEALSDLHQAEKRELLKHGATWRIRRKIQKSRLSLQRLKRELLSFKT